ncbi:MAG: S49 family peptidase, partial [Deltaproteobacteria bacterium]|nr:S49 family peptidase [Deltaproteobacteria bacterium]
MPAFRPHQTATSDGPWDGPANKVRVRSGEDRTYYGKIYAWYDPEGDEGVKETYKFIHHEVGEDGRPGPANLTACSTGIGVLNGGRGGTTIPAADRKGVWEHLAKHLKDAGKEAPPLKSEEKEQPLWLRSLQDTPWALLPAKLEEIQLFVERYLREDKPLAAALSERGRRREPEVYQVVDGVAVLQVYGMLGKRMNLLMDFSGGTSTEILAQQLRQALDDPKVGAVLLDIESPGGSVDGVKEVADLIYSSRQVKPIVAFANDLMASGAYWLGSAADRVVATETGFVGAIGVAMMHYDYSGRDAQQGVKRTAIYAGKYKRIASDEKPLSEEGAAYLQGLVDYLYGV